MLITILASIGLFFIIITVYRKGKKDGIEEAIQYFITEMKKRQIDAEVIIDEHSEKIDKSKKLNLLPFLNWRKKQ